MSILPTLHALHRLLALAGLFLVAVTGASAQTQTFPSRPVTLIVPFAAGGATDVVARLLSAEVSARLGQPVLVENKAGAAGAVGANFVAKSAPDGYTLCLCGGGPMVMLALLDPKQLPYVPTRDLAPVILSHLVDFVMVVRSDAPYKTLSQLVAGARKNPGAISYGSTGIGGPAHLGMELFGRTSGTSFLHVPYKGESNVTTDLLGGQIVLGLLSVQQAAPLIATGKVRALAVWPPVRSKALPTVPTVAESGYPGFFAGTFVGINVAAGTPAPVIDRLYNAFDGSLKKPAVSAKLEELGFTPMALPPAAYAAFLHREEEKWGKVIAETGVKTRD
jgi:tripartite-type tricarboxylate transporter receptor subunit TctC